MKPIYPIDSNGRPHEKRGTPRKLDTMKTPVDDDTVEWLQINLKLANEEIKALNKEVKRLTAEGERMIKQLDKAWNKEQLARG
jgi:HAMP domain-containing protein